MRYSLQRTLRLFVTGFTMGIADLIPGVSGGTIAFLSGIYEELLFSIKEVTGHALRLLLQGKIVQALAVIPFRFLVPVVAGMFTAIFSLAKVLAWLLEQFPTLVWAFFFGLVLASTWIVMKRVVRWDVSDKVSFVVATILTYILVGLVPVETPNSLFFIFISGAIAICAMILPGISGSFILLLMGKYHQILAAVTERDFFLLAIFASGCVIGLALFARFLTWLFHHHHDISVAVLAGVMLGSIRKIWPWKETLQTRLNSHGVEVPLIEQNIIPETLNGQVLFALALCALGMFIVFYLDKKKIIKDRTEDISDREFKAEHIKSLENQ